MAAKTDRRLEYVPLTELAAAERNPKRHDLAALGRSFDAFGYVEPVVVDERTGRLVAGHGRLERLRAMADAGEAAPAGVVVDKAGWRVPVVRGWASESDAHAEAYLAASNRLVELGGWDESALAGLLADVDAVDVALREAAGFDADELARLLAVAAPEPVALSDPDGVPEAPAEPVTRPGDVWLLGPHRLVCGDSTDPSVLAVLLGEERADCVWTDPPYGVDYVGKTSRALTIQNDARADLREFLAEAFVATATVGAEGAPWYVAAPAGPRGTDFRLAFGDAGWQFHQALVWVKDTMVLGHSDYHYRHEDVLYGWLPGPGRSGRGKHNGSRWQGDHSQTTVLEVPRPKRNEEHPTMKPVELIARCVANSTRPGAIVLDPFGGSGSTLIACHGLQRKARLVELDPAYCDVIARRYQAHTGDIPLLERDGQRTPHDLDRHR